MTAARFVVRSFGRCVSLEVPGELEAQTRLRLPPGSVETSEPAEHHWTLTGGPDWFAARDGATFAGGPDQLQVLNLLTGDLELWVAEHAAGLIFVHAGAVSWKGQAIVIPGRTFAGKSTLVAALVRAGAGYLSDEYAVIAPDGVVHPYPRHLSLRSTGGAGPTRMPVSSLGGVVSEPVPLGLVAHLRYDPEQDWAVRAISPAETILALIDNTVPARTRPLEVMDYLTAALGQASGLTGFRGDSRSSVHELMKLL